MFTQPIRNLKERLQLSRFFKGEKPTKGPIELNHRRIFIIPTLSGLGFGVLLLTLLLIAFVYNNNLAYLLCFFLASIFVVTILHTFRGLAGLKVQVGPHKPIFAGELAAIPVIIENPYHYPRLHLQIQLDQIETCTIEASCQQQIIIHTKILQRGLHELDTLRLINTFPLGLFRAWSPLRFDTPIMVYPKPAKQLIPFPDTDSDGLQSGAHQKRGGEDFSGLHEYQPGDAPKHIHWKAFAKGQGLLTKHYSTQLASEIYLHFATTPGHNLEERLSQLCRWVIDAEASGIRYGFNIPGLNLPPSFGTLHRSRCLEALACF